jgi:hypothetical protein
LIRSRQPPLPPLLLLNRHRLPSLLRYRKPIDNNFGTCFFNDTLFFKVPVPRFGCGSMRANMSPKIEKIIKVPFLKRWMFPFKG